MQNLKEYDKKEMGDPDLKVIIIGDTACGKSKYDLGLDFG